MLDGLFAGIRSLRQKLGASIRAEKERGKTLPTYEPTEEERTVLALLEEPKQIRRATLDALGPMWERNILYAAGAQHLIFSELTRELRKPRVQDWMPLPVENLIQPKVAGSVDFFTRNRPEGSVVPTNDGGERARSAAALGDKVRRYLYEINDEDDNYDEAATSLCVTGNVFSRVWGRPLRGLGPKIPKYEETDEPVMDPQTGQPVMGLDGQPVMTRRIVQSVDSETGTSLYEEIPVTEASHSVLLPFAMTVPHGHRGPLKYSPWILEAGLYSTRELQELYPRFAEYIGTEGKAITSDIHTHRITTLLGQGQGRMLRSIEPYALKGYGVVFFFERQPDADFPNGLFVVEYDGLPLVIDELPLKSQYSYEHCGYHRVLGQFWFRSPVDDMIGPQDGNNRLEQSFQYNDAVNGNPIWLEHQDAMTGPITGKPGQRVKWKGAPGMKPERVPGMSLPADTLNRKGMYRQTLEDTSGFRDVLAGKAPPGVTAGVALNMLGEDAERFFSPVTKRWDRYVERVESKKLEFVQKFYSVPRTLSVVGQDGSLIEIRDFLGAQLEGGTRFRIVSGSYRPRSLAAQQSILLRALELGILEPVMQDPGQRQKILEKLGLGEFHVDASRDYERARLENELLASEDGWQQVKRLPVDDDLVHLKVLDEEQKKPTWGQYPNHVQARFVAHGIEHLEAYVRSGGVGSGDLMKSEDDLDRGAEPVVPPQGAEAARAEGGGAQGMSDAEVRKGA